MVQYKTNDYEDPTSFHSARVDRGAERSVIGSSQALTQCTFSKKAIEAATVNLDYKFGNQRYPCTGVVKVRILLSTSEYMEFIGVVIDFDVPLFLRLNFFAQLSPKRQYRKEASNCWEWEMVGTYC